MITKIRKRDGRLTDYDITKIENAIAKAMMSIGDGEIKDCKKMAKITELYIMERFEDGIPTVEDIQDIVIATFPKETKYYVFIDPYNKKYEGWYKESYIRIEKTDKNLRFIMMFWNKPIIQDN